MDEARRLRVLRQHVKTDQLLGADAVPVAESVDEVLALQEVVVPRKMPLVAPSGPPAAAPAPARRPAATPAPAPVAAARAMSVELIGPLAAPAGPALKPQQKSLALQQLDAQQVRGCTRCQLHAGRTQTVFGEGDPSAELMFIGEGPGQTEDELGRPFVGKAGELLDKMIVAMGLARQDVYIANIVKCRPPNNRPPTPDEADACFGHLVQQVRIVRPRAIVLLGGSAAKYILRTTQGITSLRGTWQQWPALGPDAEAIAVMPTFHPAYLLRSYTPENRRKVWSDLQMVMSRLKGEPGA